MRADRATGTDGGQGKPTRGTGFGQLFGTRDVAVDLGTANTIVYVRGRGIALAEPSVVAVDTTSGEVLAVGADAKRMVGRTPTNIRAISPLEDGVIADFEVCERMLRHFIERVRGSRWGRPRMVICVPSSITSVERRAVLEAAEFAGAKRAFIIEEPMAAAIGANLPIQTAQGSMVVDIGGGTTEVAVISLGGIVSAKSLKVAGTAFDKAIENYIKREYRLSIGTPTAEEVKIALGSAWPLESEVYAEVSGSDINSGLPSTVVISSEQIRAAIRPTVMAIIDAIKGTLDDTPPDLAADIMENGIVLAGGGAELPGLDRVVQAETGIATRVAEDPMYAVVLGSGHTLEEFDGLQSLLTDSGSIG